MFDQDDYRTEAFGGLRLAGPGASLIRKWRVQKKRQRLRI